MKKNIISGFEAGKRVKELLLAHTTEVAAVAELQDSKVMLEQTLSEMETAAAIQQNDSTGESINKKDLQVTMAKTILRFSRRCRVKAKNAGDKDLAKALSHKISYYDYNNTDAVSLARCTATKDKIKNNTATLSNITPAEITEMETAISKFEAAMALPKAAISNKKVYGTDKLEELNATLDETLDDIEDLIHSYYEDTDFSKAFDQQSIQSKTGTRHNHLIIHVEDSETKAAITTAKGTIESTEKTIKTDDEGQIIFNTIRAGKRRIIIEAPSYTTKTITVYVRRSTTTEVEVELEKE